MIRAWMRANAAAKKKVASAQIQPNVAQDAVSTMFAQQMNTVMGHWLRAIPALLALNVALAVAKTTRVKRVTCG